MTIQEITCFMKLAETLSYTRTAELLYISQPAVTKHIKLLEEELGVSLIDRSSRRSIALTDAGQIYYDSLVQCSEIYNEAIENISMHSHRSVLHLNLLRGTTLPNSSVAATRQFMENNPQFSHFTNFIEHDRFTQVLDHGEVLICVRELIPSGGNYANMKLNREPVPYYIIASKGHKAFEDPMNTRMSELAGTTLFLPESMPMHVRSEVLDTLGRLFGRPPKETIYLESSDSVALFLRSNECFTIGTGWNQAVISEEYRKIQLPMTADFYAVWHTSKQKSPYCRPYLEALAKS